MKQRRIVITGLGLVCPLGNNVKESWGNLISAKSGIGKITHFDASSLSSQVAGEVKSFDDSAFVDPKEARKMDLFIRYGMAASVEALEDAGWKPDDELSRSRTGVMIGSGIGGLRAIEENAIKLYKGEKISPFFLPSCLINLASGHVSIKYGFTGPNHSVVTACATGAHAIGDAMKIIERGDADVMVAGGCEASICLTGVAGFAALRALSTKSNDNPSVASKPFDKDRDGFVISEGAGIVVLEEYEHAIKRGAKIYAEVAGYGMGGDAHHMVAPHPDGVGAITSVKAALKDASISISDVDYINAHATSTPVGDKLELNAMEKLCNGDVKYMSSTKGATGHPLGAAGSMECIFTVLALKNSILPPTINLQNPEESKFNFVPNNAIDVKINTAITNSFGFGGTNVSIVLKKHN